VTPLEQSIVDAVARVTKEGLQIRAIYLRPDEIDELGGREELGGLPLRPIRGKGSACIYTRHGVRRSIATPRRKPAPAPKSRRSSTPVPAPMEPNP
jgi:hypothetical protein